MTKHEKILHRILFMTLNQRVPGSSPGGETGIIRVSTHRGWSPF